MAIVNPSILDSIRKSYKQHCTAKTLEETKFSGGSVAFDNFQRKMNMGRGDLFSNRDLVYYFREMSGNTYHIANWKKDMAIFKRLHETYSTEDIILMIDFLFSEDNDYLYDPTINVMASSWINTIFRDSQDWADGNYVPHKKRGKAGKRASQIESREYELQWTGETPKSSIGEW